jgi:hypothetical protein
MQVVQECIALDESRLAPGPDLRSIQPHLGQSPTATASLIGHGLNIIFSRAAQRYGDLEFGIKRWKRHDQR